MRNVLPTCLALAAIFLLPGFSAALAGARDDSLSAIGRCKTIPDDRKFLDCLYGAAQPLRAELGLMSAPAFQVQLVPPDPTAVPPRQADRVGNRGTTGNVPAPGGNLRMVSYAFDPRGHFTITLSDGSVWRQLDRDQAFADWRGPAPGYYVSLKSSGMDYYLDVKGGSGPYEVIQLH